MRLGVEEAAARRPIVLFRQAARLDQELLYHPYANADLLGRRNEGMQAPLGDDLPQDDLPGSDRPVLENARPQDRGVPGEALLPGIIAVEDPGFRRDLRSAAPMRRVSRRPPGRRRATRSGTARRARYCPRGKARR